MRVYLDTMPVGELAEFGKPVCGKDLRAFVTPRSHPVKSPVKLVVPRGEASLRVKSPVNSSCPGAKRKPVAVAGLKEPPEPMFADVHPKARRDTQRYKASSSGVPDVVDEEQPTLYEGYTRVAVPRPAGDDVACCVPRLATERDDRSFARLLRRRCILPYWFLLVFVRVAETSGQYLQTGAGADAGAIWTAFFVSASTAASAAPPDVRHRFVEHAPQASLLYVVANHAIRLRRAFALAPAELEDQIGRVYGTLSSPAYYLYLFFLGFGLPLISSDRLRFQVLLVAVNLALSVAVVAAAGADATRIARPMSFYMLSIVLSNAVIYMVATPLWLRARAMEDARLERRADELDAAKDFVVWQWRFDTMELRRAATAPSSSASISSSLVEEMQGGHAPKGSNAPKALGAVPLAGSPSSLGSVRSLDLDGTP